MLPLSLYPKAPVLPTGLTLAKTELSFKAGDAYNLTATVTPENADVKTLTWSSSNVAIATVDNNGRISGVAEGSATITAETVNGIKATCAVTITAAEPKTRKRKKEEE